MFPYPSTYLLTYKNANFVDMHQTPPANNKPNFRGLVLFMLSDQWTVGPVGIDPTDSNSAIVQ